MCNVNKNILSLICSRSFIILFLAFLYSLFVIISIGYQIIFKGLLFNLASLPIYIWVQKYK